MCPTLPFTLPFVHVDPNLTQCGWCPPGTAYNYLEHGCRGCTPGEYAYAPPLPEGASSGYTESSCRRCGADTYQPLGGQAQCLECDTRAGEHAGVGSTNCTTCPSGVEWDAEAGTCPTATYPLLQILMVCGPILAAVAVVAFVLKRRRRGRSRGESQEQQPGEVSNSSGDLNHSLL